MSGGESVECPKCGSVGEQGNFCTKCYAKLRTVCDCWVKKEPYNCGQDKCPGYRLFVLEQREREM